jgi:hypothetical protein
VVIKRFMSRRPLGKGWRGHRESEFRNYLVFRLLVRVDFSVRLGSEEDESAG